MWQIKSRSGFSLIELLVVISIIGILVAIGLASYTNIQQKARDATRRGDIQAIANAMEQYFSELDQQQYPNDGSNFCDYTATGIEPYFSGPIPVDPKDGTTYTCTVDATNTTYCVCDLLEDLRGGNAADLGAAGVCNFNTLDSEFGKYYCMANRQ